MEADHLQYSDKYTIHTTLYALVPTIFNVHKEFTIVKLCHKCKDQIPYSRWPITHTKITQTIISKMNIIFKKFPADFDSDLYKVQEGYDLGYGTYDKTPMLNVYMMTWDPDQ